MWWVKIKSESRTVSRVRKPDKNFKPDENFKLRRFNMVEDMVEIFYPIFVTLWEWDKMWIEWIKFYYPDQFHPKRHLISLWLSFYQIISFQQNLKSDLNSRVVIFRITVVSFLRSEESSLRTTGEIRQRETVVTLISSHWAFIAYKL